MSGDPWCSSIALPTDALARLDALCRPFEAAWRAGQRPHLEDYLREVADELRTPLLRELLAIEVAYRRRLGEAPAADDYRDRKGVIHRDLKPHNVMVGAFGEVQVMDWGLAKVLRGAPAAPAGTDESSAAGSAVETDRTGRGDELTQAGAVLGTFAYMPPEQARGEVAHLDERCDVFGLGAILCEVLTGEAPYVGTPEEVRAQAQLGHVGPARERLGTCGAEGELVELARLCLSAGAEERPPDAAAVAAAVATYQAAAQERLRRAEAWAEEAKFTAEAARKAWRGTRGLGALLGIIFLLFPAFSFLEYRSTLRIVAAGERVASSSVALARTERVMTTLTDVALAQREYLITGDERYAESCQSAARKLDNALTGLEEATKNDPARRLPLEEMRSLIATRGQEIRESIRLRREKGFAAAQARVMADDGWASMDDLRRATVALAREEQTTLRLRKEEYENAAQGVQALIFVGNFLLLAGFTIAGVTLYREMRLRWRGEERYRWMVLPGLIGVGGPQQVDLLLKKIRHKQHE